MKPLGSHLYAMAKVQPRQAIQYYRTHYKLYLVSGILYNHESPRRALEFASRKISNGVASILFGEESKLVMGNGDARRALGGRHEIMCAPCTRPYKRLLRRTM